MHTTTCAVRLHHCHSWYSLCPIAIAGAAATTAVGVIPARHPDAASADAADFPGSHGGDASPLAASSTAASSTASGTGGPEVAAPAPEPRHGGTMGSYRSTSAHAEFPGPAPAPPPAGRTAPPQEPAPPLQPPQPSPQVPLQKCGPASVSCGGMS